MHFLSRPIDGVHGVFRYALIFFMVEITAVITIAVVSRYFLNAPVSWAEEVTRYSFVWATFLGAACAYRQRELVSMSVLINAIPAGARRKLMLLLEIVMAGFLAVATFYGVRMAQVVQPQLAVATRVSMAWLYAVVPISCGFMFLCSLDNIVNLVKGSGELAAWGEDF